MSNYISHNGIVDRIEGDSVFVRIIQQSACADCHAKSMCTASDSREKMIEVTDRSGNYRPNDSVIINGESSLGLQAVLLAFFLPLLLVITSTSIGISVFHWGETLAGVVGLSLLIPYYFILYLFRDRLKKRFLFTLKKHNP